LAIGVYTALKFFGAAHKNGRDKIIDGPQALPYLHPRRI
jgi:hypothetical protein